MTLEQYRDGVFIALDKPYKWTSYDVVNKIKFTLRAKIGHCGTLDPLASGLLVLCTGKATKRASEVQQSIKEYTGTFKLGATTPSFDMETTEDAQFETAHITDEMIYRTAKEFIGEINQAPPMYSAKKKEGKRYYDIARTGEIFEVVKSKVQLYEFEITAIEMPLISFRITCGKGFYVRSLAYDFGKALGSGAYLSSLCRTRVGEFYLEDAWKVEDFIKHIKELKAETKTDADTPES